MTGPDEPCRTSVAHSQHRSGQVRGSVRYSDFCPWHHERIIKVRGDILLHRIHMESPFGTICIEDDGEALTALYLVDDQNEKSREALTAFYLDEQNGKTDKKKRKLNNMNKEAGDEERKTENVDEEVRNVDREPENLNRKPDSREEERKETGDSELLNRAVTELQEYFAGERTSFDLPLHPKGTEFQKQVWDALRKIPYGETRSYGEIAQAIGRPKACRAVGGANNKNPIMLFIPCHRVIGSDGSLTGFAGGLDMKRRLLEMEAANRSVFGEAGDEDYEISGDAEDENCIISAETGKENPPVFREDEEACCRISEGTDAARSASSGSAKKQACEPAREVGSACWKELEETEIGREKDVKNHGKKDDCKGTAILPDEGDTDYRISETQPFYTQTRAWESTADAVCGPHGEQEKKLPPDQSCGKNEASLEDYYELPGDRRAELIDGVFYDMAAPSLAHQGAAAELYSRLRDYIVSQKGSCYPLMSPFDVQLDCDDRTMVQPDVAVVCDRSKLKNRCVLGAPDLVIEILSDFSIKRDCVLKLSKYMEAGVREYWIVDLESRRVLVYESGRKVSLSVYGMDSRIPVGIFDGNCEIDFSEIYQWIRFLLM